MCFTAVRPWLRDSTSLTCISIHLTGSDLLLRSVVRMQQGAATESHRWSWALLKGPALLGPPAAPALVGPCLRLLPSWASPTAFPTRTLSLLQVQHMSTCFSVQLGLIHVCHGIPGRLDSLTDLWMTSGWVAVSLTDVTKALRLRFGSCLHPRLAMDSWPFPVSQEKQSQYSLTAHRSQLPVVLKV